MMDISPAEVPLPDKEWHKHLEGMLTLGEVNPDIIPFLSAYQQYTINEIKKAYARFEYRERNIEKNEDD